MYLLYPFMASLKGVTIQFCCTLLSWTLPCDELWFLTSTQHNKTLGTDTQRKEVIKCPVVESMSNWTSFVCGAVPTCGCSQTCPTRNSQESLEWCLWQTRQTLPNVEPDDLKIHIGSGSQINMFQICFWKDTKTSPGTQTCICGLSLPEWQALDDGKPRTKMMSNPSIWLNHVQSELKSGEHKGNNHLSRGKTLKCIKTNKNVHDNSSTAKRTRTKEGTQ